MIFPRRLCTLPRMTRPKPLRSVQWRFASSIFVLLLLALVACTQRPADESKPAIQTSQQDEAAGGHTLRKHVGRTDAELRERLEHERHISAASTWNDRESAEAAVGAALEQQSNKISRWLERDTHPNLVLDYDGDPTHPFGRSLHRGEDRVQPCSHAVIVLKWDSQNRYHILTAYPECRS